MDNFDYKKYLAEGRLLKETKEEDYYNLLMDLGGTELAGDTFEDMMYKRGEYVSFEDFLDDELDFFQKEGDVEVIDKIKSTFLGDESVNEAGVLDRYKSGETPSREQFNRLHTNNRLAKIFSHKN